MAMLKEFVPSINRTVEVHNRLNNGLSALCPVLVNTAELKTMCGYIQQVADLLEDRKFLTRSEASVLASEYRSVVNEFKVEWGKHNGDPVFPDAVTFWMSSERVRRRFVLHKVVSMLLSVGRATVDVTNFTVPKGTVIDAEDLESMIFCVRSYFMNSDSDSYCLSEDQYVRNGLLGSKNGKRLECCELFAVGLAGQ